MKVFDITQTIDIAESINLLKKNKVENKVADIKKEYYVGSHKVFDKSLRQDKLVKVKNGKTEETKTELVNRVGISFQKRIVQSAVSFLFGNPVKLSSSSDNADEKLVVESIKKILKQNKIDSFNKRVAEDLFRGKEVSEIWFATKVEKHDTYGFSTDVKLKVLNVSEWRGSKLYPYFDVTGNMIAFCREYLEFGTNAERFDIYTDDEIVEYRKAKGEDWAEYSKNTNVLKKIPVVYATQEQYEWEDVQAAIERLETLLSNYADTNDYHSSPKIIVKGTLQGFAKKGESGAILEVDKDSSVEYLAWQQSTDAVKIEIESLFKIIYSMTQTPDISLESLKDIGQISGETLIKLLIDPHLKVMWKRMIFDEYLERRTNILKGFIKVLNPSWVNACDSVMIESEITPLFADDLTSTIDAMMTANGGQKIISRKTSMSKSGLVDDVDAELKQILEEEKAEAQQAVGLTVV